MLASASVHSVVLSALHRHLTLCFSTLCIAFGPSISSDSKRQWQSNIRSRVVGSADSPNRWRRRLQKTLKKAIRGVDTRSYIS
ncbi:hypothetical protein BD309DRAFT_969836 [Dichomitus squalens]|nr:hypothetical protein BD309DRAFT_969836 [Dichomitus squalens]